MSPSASAASIIVTRPAAQAAQWVDELRALGLQAQALPLIGIEPVADATALHAAWERLPTLALAMFVSANAVQHFFAARPDAAVWPAALPAGSTGPGTSAALREQGVVRIEEPAPDAGQFDSEALWARLARRDWRGRRVLVVRGEDGRDWLAEQLRDSGAALEFVAAYRRVAPAPGAAERALLARALQRPQQHLWLFSSSQAIANLGALAPQADWSAARALASHPRIAQAARDAGFGRVELVAPGAGAVAALLRPR